MHKIRETMLYTLSYHIKCKIHILLHKIHSPILYELCKVYLNFWLFPFFCRSKFQVTNSHKKYEQTHLAKIPWPVSKSLWLQGKIYISLLSALIYGRPNIDIVDKANPLWELFPKVHLHSKFGGQRNHKGHKKLWGLFLIRSHFASKQHTPKIFHLLYTSKFYTFFWALKLSWFHKRHLKCYFHHENLILWTSIFGPICLTFLCLMAPQFQNFLRHFMYPVFQSQWPLEVLSTFSFIFMVLLGNSPFQPSPNFQNDGSNLLRPKNQIHLTQVQLPNRLEWLGNRQQNIPQSREFLRTKWVRVFEIFADFFGFFSDVWFST